MDIQLRIQFKTFPSPYLSIYLSIYIYKDESKFVYVCVCVCHAPFEKGKPHRRG